MLTIAYDFSIEKKKDTQAVSIVYLYYSRVIKITLEPNPNENSHAALIQLLEVSSV